NGAVTGTKISPLTVVRSVNGLFDNISLAAGENIALSPSGNTLTIAAPSALTAVVHDSTLVGNGTSASALEVAVPLNLSGPVPSPSHVFGAVIKATNTAAGGFGVIANGGGSSSLGQDGGIALQANGGSGSSGGDGVDASGGAGGTSGPGGTGVIGTGGSDEVGNGGGGVIRFGGCGWGLGCQSCEGLGRGSHEGLTGATGGVA